MATFNIKKLSGFIIVLAIILSPSAVFAKRWDVATVTLERIELAPNVYAVIDTLNEEWLTEGASGATSGGFVVGDKGVFVIESFVNARLGGQLLALIKEVTDKPILYVGNTSYHGDHMYGNYLFANALIIQHEETKRYIDEKWDKDLQFMYNMFGHAEGYDGLKQNTPRTGDILITNDTEVTKIDLGGITVEVRQFGFGQTLGDLQFWVPDAKVMWLGNPIVGPAPLLPWMTEGGHKKSLDTLLRVKDFLPKGSTIVSGHSIPFKVGDSNDGLNHHIDYLETMDKKVRHAVKKKMSLMDTVDYAAMEKFNGYVLFNWSHSQMNVPCAYKHYMLEMGRKIPEEEAAIMRHCFNES